MAKKIKVMVKPSSGRQEVIEKGGELIVYLKSPPRDNKANIELIKLIKKYFDAETVKIKSGFSSPRKLLEIS